MRSRLSGGAEDGFPPRVLSIGVLLFLAIGHKTSGLNGDQGNFAVFHQGGKACTDPGIRDDQVHIGDTAEAYKTVFAEFAAVAKQIGLLAYADQRLFDAGLFHIRRTEKTVVRDRIRRHKNFVHTERGQNGIRIRPDGTGKAFPDQAAGQKHGEIRMVFQYAGNVDIHRDDGQVVFLEKQHSLPAPSPHRRVQACRGFRHTQWFHLLSAYDLLNCQ